jgi:hypothetical protein
MDGAASEQATFNCNGQFQALYEKDCRKMPSHVIARDGKTRPWRIVLTAAAANSGKHNDSPHRHASVVR